MPHFLPSASRRTARSTFKEEYTDILSVHLYTLSCISNRSSFHHFHYISDWFVRDPSFETFTRNVHSTSSKIKRPILQKKNIYITRISVILFFFFFTNLSTHPAQVERKYRITRRCNLCKYVSILVRFILVNVKYLSSVSRNFMYI